MKGRRILTKEGSQYTKDFNEKERKRAIECIEKSENFVIFTDYKDGKGDSISVMSADRIPEFCGRLRFMFDELIAAGEKANMLNLRENIEKVIKDVLKKGVSDDTESK